MELLKIEKLKVKNQTIRTIPEEKLNLLLLGEGGLSDWIMQQLSIKPTEENITRVEAVLPEIKYHCMSLSIAQVMEALQMYVRGELPLEPRDNYLTPIIFGKIIKAYKQQRRPVRDMTPLPEPDPAQEKIYALENIMLAYDHYIEKHSIPEIYVSAFDRMYQVGILPGREDAAAAKRYDFWTYKAHILIWDELERTITREKAAPGASTPALLEAKQTKREIAEQKYQHPRIVSLAKRLIMESFFKRMTRDQLHDLADRKLSEYFKAII